MLNGEGWITTATVAEIDFSWDINALAGNPRLLDKLTLLVYCPMMSEYVAAERVVEVPLTKVFGCWWF